MENILRGQADTPMHDVDRFFSPDIVGHLFPEPNKTFGMDLVAVDIQRGRDQGIPGYNAYREWCHIQRAKTFADFEDFIPAEVVEKLKTSYEHVDDVDLFVAGILETPTPGALLGPTFQCIIGDQFLRLKEGDRFWYEGGNSNHAFTPEQLQEILKVSFARILCDNGDDLEKMQLRPFTLSAPLENSKVDCRSDIISRVNLRHWKEDEKDNFVE